MLKTFKNIFYILLVTFVSYGGVMMQGFYWDCPEGWYQTMQKHAHQLRYMKDSYGINRIWFPPPQKSDFGIRSMGYDPYDYYDVGEYDQKGSTPTRFGSKQDLQDTIKIYQKLDILCMADLVLNHRSGGNLESNPNAQLYTMTDFSSVASRKCIWRYNNFHPSSYEKSDIGAFKDYPDICHVTGDQELVAGFDLIEWGKWLQQEIGFNGGWRFDYAKGIQPAYIMRFQAQTQHAFSVIEYWDDIDKIDAYLGQAGQCMAFDFPLFYKMVEVFNHDRPISQLVDPKHTYVARNPSKAITFVANHDTDKDTFVESIDQYPMLAYAFILTYQGYPCLFWKDYFDYGLSNIGDKEGNGINGLVWAREALTNGDPKIEILNADNEDILVYSALGDNQNKPGYIVMINNSDISQSVQIKTSNRFLKNKTLRCIAWYSYERNKKPSDIFCNQGGWSRIKIPSKGYAVYSSFKLD